MTIHYYYNIRQCLFVGPHKFLGHMQITFPFHSISIVYINTLYFVYVFMQISRIFHSLLFFSCCLFCLFKMSLHISLYFQYINTRLEIANEQCISKQFVVMGKNVCKSIVCNVHRYLNEIAFKICVVMTFWVSECLSNFFYF